MKNVVLLFILVFAINSCSVEGDPGSEIVSLPIESVIMPDVYHVNQVSQITVKYRRPTDCHLFNGFYYGINENTRIVAVNAVKLNQNNCQDVSENLFEVPLDFKPTVDGSYIFKFWTGTNTDGVDQFLIYQIEVLP